MQLTRHTDFCLRVLLYLAVRPDERVTLAEISAHFKISHEHLRKVVHELSRKKFIHTYQGKGGGMELAHRADAIRVGDVVENFEGCARLIDCEGINCTLANFCTLQSALADAQRQFIAALNKYTVADLVNNRAMRKGLAVARENS